MVNTNIWFWWFYPSLTERDQKKFQPPYGKKIEETQQKVHEFFDELGEKLFITDFSLHSIGIRLARLKRYDLFLQLVSLMGERIVRLDAQDYRNLVNVANQFGLSFDDPYQYIAALKVGLEIVSFDPDFDRTDKKRLTPEQVLERERRR